MLHDVAKKRIKCDFWLPHVKSLVPWPGIEPMSLALEVQSLNQWTTREVQVICDISVFIYLKWNKTLIYIAASPLQSSHNTGFPLSQGWPNKKLGKTNYVWVEKEITRKIKLGPGGGTLPCSTQDLNSLTGDEQWPTLGQCR